MHIKNNFLPLETIEFQTLKNHFQTLENSRETGKLKNTKENSKTKENMPTLIPITKIGIGRRGKVSEKMSFVPTILKS